MEDWQIEYINSHLKELRKVTKCNSELLEELKSIKVLNKKDVKRLENEKQEKGEKAEKTLLYTMLQGHSNGYESLITSLQKSNNPEAATILENGSNPQQTNTLLDPPNPKTASKKIPKNKFFRYLSKAWLTVLVAGLISAFILVYLINYLEIKIWLAIPIAAISGPLVFALQLIPFARATLLLTTPELTSRTLRILLVQTLIALMPLQGLQSSSNTFVDSIVCTNQKAVDAATEGSTDVLRNAMNGVQASISAVNRVSDKIQEVVRGPLNGFEKNLEGFDNMLLWVEGLQSTCNQAVSGINGACGNVLGATSTVCDNTLGKVRVRRFIKGVFDKVKDEVNKGMGAVSSGANHVVGGVNQGFGTVQNGINQIAEVCSKTHQISSNCDKIQGLKACNGFAKVGEFRQKVIKWKEDAVNKALREFGFVLKTDSGVNASDQGSLDTIKSSLADNLKEKLDFFFAFKTIWGMILSISVFFIIISKALLVRKYISTGKLKLKPISIFFILMNPFILQICFLLLIGVMHMSFYMFHDMFRQATLGKDLTLSTEFNASVTVEGGRVGKQIANLLIESFELQKSINTTLSFEECFQEEVMPPSFWQYGIVVVISLIGLLTYAVDIYSRKRHVALISFVYPKKLIKKLRKEKKEKKGKKGKKWKSLLPI